MKIPCLTSQDKKIKNKFSILPSNSLVSIKFIIVFIFGSFVVGGLNFYSDSAFAFESESDFKKNIASHTSVNKKTEIAPELSTEHLVSNQFENLPAAKKLVTKKTMVVTANPYATQAAELILQEGGSAIDAALAAQLVLGLVEPQSSGIGGGAFLIYWDNKEKTISAWDGRETAPMAVDEDWFLDENKKPLTFFDAVVGGRSVGVPGVLAMFEKLHQQYGKNPWQENFESAIELAENGFIVSSRLNYLLENLYGPKPEGRFAQIYYPNGKPLKTGQLFSNQPYANSLKQIAEGGAKVFYQGRLASEISRAVQQHTKSGVLAIEDLKNYQAKKREALCTSFLEYQICGMPPPSSGASTVAAILGVLENLELSKLKADELAHVFLESSKLAFADRDYYLADPDFVEVPLNKLLDKNYLKNRAQLIDVNKSIKYATPGLKNNHSQPINPELPSTTHISIVDQYGNAVSMTSSIEMAFGSRVMVGGFILNNQLTDFSFSPRDENQQLINNRVQAGKRPRSSMSPTIVLKNNQPVLIIGSPGGSRIIDFVAKPLLDILKFETDIEEAINKPHWIAMNKNKIEVGEAANEELVEGLKRRGQTVIKKQHSSGLHVIQIKDKELIGAADQRREGSAAGF